VPVSLACPQALGKTSPLRVSQYTVCIFKTLLFTTQFTNLQVSSFGFSLSHRQTYSLSQARQKTYTCMWD
jgi:hypothetical protein